jgi:hypothetical protein
MQKRKKEMVALVAVRSSFPNEKSREAPQSKIERLMHSGLIPSWGRSSGVVRLYPHLAPVHAA